VEEYRILTPQGMLGYGVPEEDFWRGMGAKPDVIIMDGGSTDPGPYLLGLGKTIVSRQGYLRDLRIVLEGVGRHRVPLIVTSAGGAGTNAQVETMIELIREVAAELGHSFKLAAIYSDIEKAVVLDSLAGGRIIPCASAPPLNREDVETSTNIVAQMGAEPIATVLTEHPDVDIILTGRSYDPAPFAAFCATKGIDPGLYWHLGKIAECGALCAEPKGKAIMVTVRKDSFDLEPLAPNARCTPISVAAHTLYEKSRPDLLAGPGGVLDLTNSRYEQLTDRIVRVRGSEFIPSDTYQVKVEGAAPCGFRSTFIGGIRDPILIGQIDRFLASVREELAVLFSEVRDGDAQIHFHVYGRDGVMGPSEPLRDHVPHEIGLLGEVTAATQEMATAICTMARIWTLHLSYPGQMATAGNFAIPLNPPDNEIGQVCRFSIYHLMDVDDPTSLFPVKTMDIV